MVFKEKMKGENKEFEEKYSELVKKYKLPKLMDIEEKFELIKGEKNTNFILRSVRKSMIEKVGSLIGFLEMLLNPMNAPRMYIPFISSMGVDDKGKIDELYGTLAGFSFSSMELEFEYNEELEASLIKEIYSSWGEISSVIHSMVAKMKLPVSSMKKEKSYFG